jgi:hypothetical protein
MKQIPCHAKAHACRVLVQCCICGRLAAPRDQLTLWLLSDENQAYMVSVLRGRMTMKHPFLSEDAHVVTLADPPPDVMQRLVTYWRTYMEPKK